jgi:hypothetical protein
MFKTFRYSLDRYWAGAVPYLGRLDRRHDFVECRAKIDELPSVYLNRLYYDTVNFNSHADDGAT